MFKDKVQDYVQGRTDYIPIFLKFSADGFCPYSKRSNYSAWNFMFEILNLPIPHRIKIENMMLFTIAPGPKCPKSMNGILDLIVDELDDLWKAGFEFSGYKFKVYLGLIVEDHQSSERNCSIRLKMC
jgi:hypothetical protein